MFLLQRFAWADHSMDLHLDLPASPTSSGTGTTSRIVVERGKYRAYEARIGKKVVGKAYPWHDSENQFVMMEVAVHASFRRRGVATAIYSTIEREHGKLLKPATSLSDDGFEFWKRYRPEAVADDLRHWSNVLAGARVLTRYGLGTIFSASGASVSVDLDVPAINGGIHAHVHRRDLNEALRAAGEPPLVPARLDATSGRREMLPESHSSAVLVLR